MAADDLASMLDRLREAADTVGANLLELERDPTYELLHHMTLRSETLRQWQQAEATLARLWEWFSALCGVLDTARLTKSRHTMHDLLTGASVSVVAPDEPLLERTLLQPASRVEHHTPDGAIALMEVDFDEVRLVVRAVALTWDVALPRLRGAEATLDELAVTAVEVGADGSSRVKLREDIAGLADALIADPLSVSPDAIDALSRRVSEVEAEVRAALAFRAHVTAVLDEAEHLASDVEDRSAAARTTRAEVTAKIMAVEVPAASENVDAFRAELVEIERLVAGGRWLDAERRLEAWIAAATEMLGALDRATTAMEQPLQHRSELRGRLDGYHAKVGRVGRSEDPELDALYQAARTELYTAPTDLIRAAQLVTEYADAIAAEEPKKPARRSG